MSVGNITHYPDISFPPKNDHIDFTSALAALNRQRVARIAKVAIYIFATIATAASIMLTEAAIISLPITLSALLVTVTTWLIFWRLNSLDDAYVDKIDDHQRSELARMEFERLLFHEKLNSFKSGLQLALAFEDINKVVSYPLFSTEFLQKLLAIKEQTSNGNKTIYEAAKELTTPLSLCTHNEIVERGWFGKPPLKRKIEFKWDGEKDEGIVLHMTTEKLG